MSDECPVISIIIPAYNTGKYLGACLDSITGQTFTDWELIIVDDGSQDDTGKIADKYASVDNRIRVIHKTNGGVSAARNDGIEIARGIYLSFVDSDDRLERTYLEELYSHAVQSGADITQCSFFFEDENGRRITDPNGIDADYKDNAEIMKAYFNGHLGDIRISVWAKLFKREQFTDVCFDQSLRIYEDACYVYECCKKAKTVCSTDAPLYFYRQHKSSTMHLRLTGIYLDYFKVFERQREDFRDERPLVGKIAVREAECALWLIRVMITEGKQDELWDLRKKAHDVTGKILWPSAPLLLKMKLAGLALMPHLYFALVKRRVLSGNEKV